MHARRWLVFCMIAVVGAGTAGARDLDGFARCLRGRRATLYGAAWCPECKAQRALFGRAARWVPYVECSVDGTRAIRSECAGIAGFPTWVLGDGSRVTGRVPLDRLASATGCALDAPRAGPLVIDVPGGGGVTSPNGSGVRIIEIP